LFGAGLSITQGLKGQATSWGGGIDILTSDYYASIPDKSLIGLDLGVGFGSPVSGWRISTLASPITPRIDVTFWAEDD
jgi:hypothetical protein